MELLRCRTDIIFASVPLNDSLREYDAVLAMRFSQQTSEEDWIAANIGQIVEDLSPDYLAETVLGLLTEQDKIRFARHVVLVQQRHDTLIEEGVQMAWENMDVGSEEQ
jgi:hypothetical protein